MGKQRLFFPPTMSYSLDGTILTAMQTGQFEQVKESRKKYRYTLILITIYIQCKEPLAKNSRVSCSPVDRLFLSL